MKKIVILIILAEMLDFITTIIGLRLGFVESNLLLPTFGWGALNLLKILVTIFIILGLILGYKIMPRYFTVIGVIIIAVAIQPVVSNVILFLS